MPLDVSTITFAGAVVAMASALFLLLYWTHERTAWAALWWAGASCTKGIGISMLAFHAALPIQEAQHLAPLILNLSGLLTWIAASQLAHREVRAWPLIAGAAGWVMLVIGMNLFVSGQVAGAVSGTLSGSLYAAAAVAVWQGRVDRLQGRWPMLGLLAMYAVALFLVAAQRLFSVIYMSRPSLDWLGIVHFVELIYSIGVTMFLIMMLKERSDVALKAAALTDPLTGLANRRAFMERTHLLLERMRRGGEPIRILAFDLDRFKAVNDTFGHATGDQVLRVFADTLARGLRPNDLASRLGGEEFVAAISGLGIEGTLAVAERIRRNFQDNGRVVAGVHVGATVSVGVATAGPTDIDVAAALAEADAALYRAKALGRNCVILAGEDPLDRLGPNVVPIAAPRLAG